MELHYISRQKYWRDAADSINSNFTSVGTSIDELLKNTKLSKGIFSNVTELKEAYPNPPENSWAAVESLDSFYLFIFEDGNWENTGQKMSFDDMELEDYTMSEYMSDPVDILDDY
jgi:hypothetical protein